MTGIKISALTAIVAPATSDVFPVVQSGVTYKETIQQLFTLLGTDAIFTNPQITGCILDSNGNEILCFSPAASAVNHLVMSNSATGNALGFGAAGTDSNITLSITGKGNGGAQIQGLTSGGTVSTGFVGEIISENIPSASATSLVSGTSKDITSISLSAGHWHIQGNVYVAGSGNNLTAVSMWSSLTSATLPDLSLVTQSFPKTGSDENAIGLTVPLLIIDITTTTTVYLSCRGVFSSTATACGSIFATRL